MKKGLGFKILIIILVLLLAGAVFQLVETFSLHTMNVHTEIKAMPPGIARIIEGNEESFGSAPILGGTENSPSFTPTTGGSQEPPSTAPTTGGDQEPPSTAPTAGGDQEPPSTTPPPDGKDKPPAAAPPAGGGGGGAPSGLMVNMSNQTTALTINTDIDFGTTFPGETREGEFIVYLNTMETPEHPGPYYRAEYHLIISANASVSGNMTPYMTVVRDPTETDLESDNVTSASLDSTQDPSDTSDRWLVTFIVPDDLTSGDYAAVITVWVDQTYE